MERKMRKSRLIFVGISVCLISMIIFCAICEPYNVVVDNCVRIDFYDDFEDDTSGILPLLSPPGDPPNDAISIQGSKDAILILDSAPLDSRALKINRQSNPGAVLECTPDNRPLKDGKFYVTFTAYNTHVGGDTPSMTISINSRLNKTAMKLVILDNKYNLISGAGTEVLFDTYNVNEPDKIEILINFYAGNVTVDINSVNQAIDRPFIDHDFGDLYNLRFEYPATILEAFEANYIVDDIKICRQKLESNVGAYYYPWYSGDFHGGQYLREHLVPPQELFLGEYDDRDDSVIRQHLQWSRYAGISFWIT
ncbi:hypothetical protein ACFL67_01840, partial [candidate division KSB1 bacterium]